MRVKKYPYLQDKLVFHDGPDRLCSLLISPEAPSFSLNQSLFFLFVPKNFCRCFQDGSLTRFLGWGHQCKEIHPVFAAGQPGILLVLAQAATNIEHLCRITFLPWCGFELQFELAADEMMVSMALRTGHHFCM